MIYQILVFLFVFLSILLVFLILLQQSKNSMGLSGISAGSTQMIFGGSGGQDIFQKITWFLGISFMVISLVLALIKKGSSSLIITKLENAYSKKNLNEKETEDNLIKDVKEISQDNIGNKNASSNA